MSNLLMFDKERLQRRVEPPAIAGRPPPHDLVAEAAVLSATLLSADALKRALAILAPEQFYSEANVRIFQAAQHLSAAGTPTDMVSVASWLRDREWLGKVGGTAYLSTLADAAPALENVDTYARTVHEKWRLRQLIATCQRVSAEGYGDCGDIGKFIEAAESSVGIIRATAATAKMVGVVAADAVHDALLRAEEAANGGRVGTSWGWTAADERVGLLVPKGNYVVAARSGHGKTQFATQTALNITSRPAVNGYQDALYFASYEMPREILVLRMMCAEAGVYYKRVIAGKISMERRPEYDGADCTDPVCRAAYSAESYHSLPINRRGEKVCRECADRTSVEQAAPVQSAPSESERMTSAARLIMNCPIVFDDVKCPPRELAARVKAAQERFISGTMTDRSGKAYPKAKVRAVMVDFIQNVPVPPGRYSTRQVEVAAIVTSLLDDVAKGCDVALVALAQVNRGVDKQKDPRPTLADIREAGDIENLADEIIGLHREQYRLRDKTPPEWQNIAELIHLKGRGGLDAELAPAKMWFTQGKFYNDPAEGWSAWEQANCGNGRR